MDDRHETLSVCECIQRIMTNHHLKLSTAESCTGGRIASSLTAVPGSSAYFIGSVVAYQNEVKERLLDVDSDDIDKYEVVSREGAEHEPIFHISVSFDSGLKVIGTGRNKKLAEQDAAGKMLQQLGVAHEH